MLSILVIFIVSSCARVKNDKKNFSTPEGNLADIVKLELQIFRLQSENDSLKNLSRQNAAIILVETRYYEKVVQENNIMKGKNEYSDEKSRKNKNYIECKVDSRGYVWKMIEYDAAGKIRQDKYGLRIFMFNYSADNLIEKIRFKSEGKISHKYIYEYRDNKRTSTALLDEEGNKIQTIIIDEE